MPSLVYLVTEDWYFVSHRLPLAIAAKNAGYEVTVVTRCGDAAESIRSAGITLIPFEMARRGLNPFGLIHEVVQVTRLYRRLAPDIVHHVALRPVVVGGLAARLAGVRNVVSAVAGLGFAFAGGRAGWLASVMRRLLRMALARGDVIVQNPEDRSFIVDLGVNHARAHLILGAGIDVDRFSPKSADEGSPVVMLASRLIWDKGIGEFVHAATKLKGQARFVLVGTPDPSNPASITSAELAKLVDDGILEWWGHRKDMATVLSQSAIFCLPTWYREGLPKVLLEAMACGRACVTTDAPGCRDAVRDGDNGLLVPARDADALVAAVRRLLTEPALRQRMGARGRERAVAEFSVAQVVAETLTIYRRVTT